MQNRKQSLGARTQNLGVPENRAVISKHKPTLHFLPFSLIHSFKNTLQVCSGITHLRAVNFEFKLKTAVIKITRCIHFCTAVVSEAKASPIEKSEPFHLGRISTEYKTKAGIRETQNCCWKKNEVSNQFPWLHFLCRRWTKHVTLAPQLLHCVSASLIFFRLPPSRYRNLKAVFNINVFPVSFCKADTVL